MSSDRIYYNILIPFDPSQANNPYYPGRVPAKFSAQLNQSILDRPQDYYVSVIRFNVPTQEIPLFIAEVQPFPNTEIGQNSIGGVPIIPTVYSVTLEYNGGFSPETFVNFVSTSPNLQLSQIPTASNPIPQKLPYYYVYTYTAFIDMVNTALATAFAALPLAPVGSEPPYFQYDPINQKISLVAQAAFYDQALPNPINIYMNFALFRFFDGIEVIYRDNYITGGANPPGTDFQFLVKDNNNNRYQPDNIAPYYVSSGTQANYLIMTQEYPTLSNWNDFKSLFIVSNMIPVNKEVVPTFNSNGQIGVNQSTVNFQPVLQSFEPYVQFGYETRTFVQYQNPGQYQLLDLNSTRPIDKIDIQVFWANANGEFFPIYFGPGNACTIKLAFIRKGTY